MGIGASVVPLTPKQYRRNADAAEEMAFDAMRIRMEEFTAHMRAYPSPKTGSKYRRSQALWAAWNVTYRRGIYMELYNTERYAIFVHGGNHGEGQQQQHANTGWLNMYEEFQKYKPRFVGAAQGAFNKWATRMGF